jgi:hypothetical protein
MNPHGVVADHPCTIIRVAVWGCSSRMPTRPKIHTNVSFKRLLHTNERLDTLMHIRPIGPAKATTNGGH